MPATPRAAAGWVVAGPGEPFEDLLHRFRRTVEAAGVLRDYRRKQRFVPAHEERREKVRGSRRRSLQVRAATP